MIYSLLEKLQGRDRQVLATIMRTEGHTYKKSGHKALFVVGEDFPVYGNLGSLCADQDIVRTASQAWKDGKPRVLVVDTSDESDIELGYGTYCGGKMELLIEPILDAHKSVYREIAAKLGAGSSVYVAHQVETGGIALSEVEPGASDGVFVERLWPPRKLVIIGATPLAREIVHHLVAMDFDIHVHDRREAHLERFRSLPHIKRHSSTPPLDQGSCVLLLSHNFSHDVDALETALRAGCGYVGLLSSRTRRDHMFEELLTRGMDVAQLKRVSAPVGIDIGARTDAEIAVSIVAELVRHVRQ